MNGDVSTVCWFPYLLDCNTDLNGMDDDDGR